MTLSEFDVTKQIQQMISFIQQEAAEKVEEIEVKTEEEFNIEKSRLVSQQRIKIIEYYDKKEKQIEIQQKIQHSNLANASRLSILKARDECIEAFKEEIRKKLDFSKVDRSKYIIILSNLIIQGLYTIIEPIITIRCRHDDYGLVQRLIPDAIRQYKQTLNKDIEIHVDQKNFLSDKLTGGIELYAMNDKIKVLNTIEARLDIIFHQMLPEIRKTLFGTNHNRKYYD
ncbi:unnamed protein product [Adineta ricciae]|uniref:V-type proton ATPase subunit E n=1 Tax=Adineta ricciae TaxID=249248 RepID=A0A815M642_ADIRI|nr:unnamed protein product [Adineta ricciae]